MIVNNQNRDFKGVWIPKEIYLNNNLNWTEKILFVEIDSLDNENGCSAGNEYLSGFIGISKIAISNEISKLKRLGMIEQISFNGRKRILRVTENFKAELKKTLMQDKSKDKGRVKENFNHNNIYNNTDNNTTILQSKIAEDKEPLKSNKKQDEPIKAESTTKLENPINILIAKFEPINPSYTRLFANKSQRGAMERMIETHGLVKMIGLLDILPKVLGKKYAPMISTPIALENKMGDLLQFIKKNNFLAREERNA